jgi:hypothetical protein
VQGVGGLNGTPLGQKPRRDVQTERDVESGHEHQRAAERSEREAWVDPIHTLGEPAEKHEQEDEADACRQDDRLHQAEVLAPEPLDFGCRPEVRKAENHDRHGRPADAEKQSADCAPICATRARETASGEFPRVVVNHGGHYRMSPLYEVLGHQEVPRGS